MCTQKIRNSYHLRTATPTPTNPHLPPPTGKLSTYAVNVYDSFCSWKCMWETSINRRIVGIWEIHVRRDISVSSCWACLPTNHLTNRTDNKQTAMESRDLCRMALMNTETLVSGLYSGGFMFENWVGHRGMDGVYLVFLSMLRQIPGRYFHVLSLPYWPFTDLIYLNTLRTGLLNCLNARSRGLIQSEVRFL